MDAFPSYSDLVMTVTTVVFCLCYAAATGALVLASRAGHTRFSLSSVVFALLAAFSASALSFFVLLAGFGPS